MVTERVHVDYLVVGAGAMGMAFTDEILTSLPHATVALVDRRARPGGHWTDAYPFVRLHQPAAFYGLNSQELGTGGADLSSGPEIEAYYERALQGFLRTGRVQFFGRCDYVGGGRATSVLDPDVDYQFTARRRVVDATFLRTEIPATHGPSYEVGEGVELVPPNDLVHLREPHERYVVVGGGKTGGDAVVFLLRQGVSAERIQWIVPRDMWMFDRRVAQPDVAHEEIAREVVAVATSRTPHEAFLQLERAGSVFRLDPAVTPQKWRCATFDQEERRLVQSVSDVVRLGRVVRIGGGEVKLEHGTVPLADGSLVVNCSAMGLPSRAPRPVFEPGRITLQAIMFCQQVFSAAAIGHLEAKDLTDEQRNGICRPVPNPVLVEDMPQVLMASVNNVLVATRHMPVWLARSRLNMLAHASTHDYARTVARILRHYPAATRHARRLRQATRWEKAA